VDDPAAAEGTGAEREAAFETAFRELEARVRRLVALPLETLDAAALKEALQAIGRA
jgi:arsenate reductase